MNRFCSMSALALLLTGLAAPATAQKPDFRACAAKSDAETNIAVCTRAINSGQFHGKQLAIPYNNRGMALTMKGEFDRAITDLNEAIRLDPRLTFAYVNRGISYFGKQDYDRAIAEFNEALRINPKDVDALHHRGRAFYEKRDLDRALADYNAAIRLDPKSASTYAHRGNIFHQQHDHDRAVADYSEALRLNPKLVSSLTGRAISRQAKGDLNAAYRDAVEALALEPANADIQRLRDQLRTALVGPASPPAKTNVAAPAPASAPAAAPQSPASASAIGGPRVALVIGNGRYQHATALPNPANDAADIAGSLRKLGFEVIEGRDLDKRGMEDRVRQFGRKLDGAKLALFFYAGHGLQVGGRNYLIPVDGKLERQGDLSFETIDVSQVLAQMEAEQRVNLVFLDACRDNPLTRSFARVLGTRSTAVGQGLASIQSTVGTMIAYATQPDAVALDGTGRNSPFTTALLKHINTRGLEIGSMMRRVRADVVQVTNGKQVPWDHSSLLGDVVLAQ